MVKPKPAEPLEQMPFRVPQSFGARLRAYASKRKVSINAAVIELLTLALLRVGG